MLSPLWTRQVYRLLLAVHRVGLLPYNLNILVVKCGIDANKTSSCSEDVWVWEAIFFSKRCDSFIWQASRIRVCLHNMTKFLQFIGLRYFSLLKSRICFHLFFTKTCTGPWMLLRNTIFKSWKSRFVPLESAKKNPALDRLYFNDEPKVKEKEQL